MAPRPATTRSRLVLALALLALASRLAEAADPRRPAQRLAGDDAGDDRGRASSRAVVATARSTPGLPPPHHHENALEVVRWQPALASAAAWTRQRNGEQGGGFSARLSVNASWAIEETTEEAEKRGGGSDGSSNSGNSSSAPPPKKTQVVHATPATRAAEALRVSWSGLQDASVDDMIAVLLLPQGDDDDETQGGAIAKAAPAKFSLLGAAAAPSGSLDLRLANYLSPRVALVLLRGGLDDNPTLGAPPLVLCNAADGRAPLHRRLSLAQAAPSSPSSSVALAVRWTTRLPGGSPGVWWTAEPPGPTAPGGAAPKRAYENFAPAVAAASAAAAAAGTYSRSDLCGGDAAGVGFVEPGFFHTAVIDGLVPGKRYWYVVGNAAGDPPAGAPPSPLPPPPPPDEAVRSPEASFLAPPPGESSSSSASGDGGGRVRVLITADMGQAEPDGWSQALSYTGASSVRTARALEAEAAAAAAGGGAESAKNGDAPPPYSLVLHAGDISYARGYGALWAAFHDLVEPIAAAVPYMVAPGNHERNWPGSGDRFSAGTGEAGAREEKGAAATGSGGGDGTDDEDDDADARSRAARGDRPARDVFDSGGECGVPYARRFAMPEGGTILSSSSSAARESGGNGGGGDQRQQQQPPAAAPSALGVGDKPWYAFDHGPNVRFVVFSTEHDFMPGSEQHAFLERAFAGARSSDGESERQGATATKSANGDAPPLVPPPSNPTTLSEDDAPLPTTANTTNPWLVLVGHRPIHVCSSWDGLADSDAAVSRALRAALGDLLERYAVDLTISGHHHSYGRSCAVVEEEEEGGGGVGEGRGRGGGGGGGGEERQGRRAWRLGRATCAPEPPFSSAPEDGRIGASTPERRGTVHVVAGNGGAPLTLNAAFPPAPLWRRLRYDWGYLRLDATRDRLRVESVTAATGEAVDRFELVRDKGRREEATRAE